MALAELNYLRNHRYFTQLSSRSYPPQAGRSYRLFFTPLFSDLTFLAKSLHQPTIHCESTRNRRSYKCSRSGDSYSPMFSSRKTLHQQYFFQQYNMNMLCGHWYFHGMSKRHARKRMASAQMTAAVSEPEQGQSFCNRTGKWHKRSSETPQLILIHQPAVSYPRQKFAQEETITTCLNANG